MMQLNNEDLFAKTGKQAPDELRPAFPARVPLKCRPVRQVADTVSVCNGGRLSRMKELR